MLTATIAESNQTIQELKEQLHAVCCFTDFLPEMKKVKDKVVEEIKSDGKKSCGVGRSS